MNFRTAFLIIIFPFFSVLNGQDGWTNCEGLSIVEVPTAKALNINGLSIDIDGQSLEPFWLSAPSYGINISLKNPGPLNEDDFAGYFQLAWNRDYLFALVVITDDTIVSFAERSDCKTWQNDCVEFFVNPDGKTRGICPDMEDLDEGSEIHANPGDDDIIKSHLAGLGYHNTVSPIPDYHYKSVQNEKGYTLEVQIPWYMLSDSLAELISSKEPRETVAFGFDVNVCDSDDRLASCSDLRQHIMSWASDKTNNFKNTSRYGILELEGSGIEEINTYAIGVELRRQFAQDIKRLQISSEDKMSRVEVYSISGSLIKIVDLNKVKSCVLDCNALNEGLYILRISYINKKNRSFKFII